MINLNSGQTIKFDKTKVLALAGVLSEKMKEVPTYLVDKDTIDRIYPPEKRKHLDEKRVKDILKNNQQKSVDELDKMLEECQRETKKIVVGVYVKNVPDWLKSSFDGIVEPAVFICPERCVEWGNKLGVTPSFVFTKVLFHEYGHAFLDTDGATINYYDTWWGKVIEESLANYIAFTRFRSSLDRANATKLIGDQPIEYRGCWFFDEGYPFLVVKNIILRYSYTLLGTRGIGTKIETLRKISLLFPFWRKYKYSGDKNDEFAFKNLALHILDFLVR